MALASCNTADSWLISNGKLLVLYFAAKLPYCSVAAERMAAAGLQELMAGKVSASSNTTADSAASADSSAGNSAAKAARPRGSKPPTAVYAFPSDHTLHQSRLHWVGRMRNLHDQLHTREHVGRLRRDPNMFEDVESNTWRHAGPGLAACTAKAESTNSKSNSNTDPCTASPSSSSKVTSPATSIFETQYVEARPSMARAAPWPGSKVELAEADAAAATFSAALAEPS